MHECRCLKVSFAVQEGASCCRTTILDLHPTREYARAAVAGHFVYQLPEMHIRQAEKYPTSVPPIRSLLGGMIVLLSLKWALSQNLWSFQSSLLVQCSDLPSSPTWTHVVPLCSYSPRVPAWWESGCSAYYGLPTWARSDVTNV
jgi:hypothetical protein